LDLTLSPLLIALSIPLHPKNWFTLLLVYEIEFVPDIKEPESEKPIVESTETTDYPIETFSKDFVFGLIIKFPNTVDSSSYPMNNSIL